MNRHEQDIVAVGEDRLRAVAVVIVDVENRNPLGATVANTLGGDRGIAQIALAAEGMGSDLFT